LTQWEGSVTRRNGVMTLTGGETAPERRKGGDEVSWDDANLTGLKNKKNHVVHSTGTNGR
jgi:hypothetical protein